jgi:hypothetical protein
MWGAAIGTSNTLTARETTRGRISPKRGGTSAKPGGTSADITVTADGRISAASGSGATRGRISGKHGRTDGNPECSDTWVAPTKRIGEIPGGMMIAVSVSGATGRRISAPIATIDEWISALTATTDGWINAPIATIKDGISADIMTVRGRTAAISGCRITSAAAIVSASATHGRISADMTTADGRISVGIMTTAVGRTGGASKPRVPSARKGAPGSSIGNNDESVNGYGGASAASGLAPYYFHARTAFIVRRAATSTGSQRGEYGGA